MTINWGVRIASTRDPLFAEIVAVEEALNRFRSTTGNWVDYVPLLRWVDWARGGVGGAGQRALAREMRDRRDGYLAAFNRELEGKVEGGTARPCIQASVVMYRDERLSAVELTSISLSMLGGGFETVSTTVQWSVGFLAGRGAEVQERAYRAICEFRGEGEGSEGGGLADAGDEGRCAYVLALAKEALRFFTVIPLNLPRETIRDVVWEGVVVPRGTTVYMNAVACNYGEFTTPVLLHHNH